MSDVTAVENNKSFRIRAHVVAPAICEGPDQCTTTGVRRDRLLDVRAQTITKVRTMPALNEQHLADTGANAADDDLAKLDIEDLVNLLQLCEDDDDVVHDKADALGIRWPVSG